MLKPAVTCDHCHGKKTISVEKTVMKDGKQQIITVTKDCPKCAGTGQTGGYLTK
jgi:hypothetical protein